MNIILLTSVYPAKDAPKGTTLVVHYFAKEWIAQGHRVHVFHLESSFPKTYYLIGKFSLFLSRSLKVVLSMHNLKALKRFFELLKLSRSEISYGTLKYECLHGLSGLEHRSGSSVIFCLAYISELLDVLGDAAYHDVLPLLREHLSEWPEGAGPYVSQIVNVLDETDERHWISNTRFD